MTQQIVRDAVWLDHSLPNPFARKAGGPRIPVSWVATGLACSCLIVGVMMRRAGIGVSIVNSGFILSIFALTVLAGLRIVAHRPATLGQYRLRDFSEHMFLFVITCLLGVFATYPAAAATVGFTDPMLARMDNALHFDWIAMYRVVLEYPMLRTASSIAYSMIYVSPIILMAAFAWTHRADEAREFLITFWLGAMLTVLLFMRLPAEGPLAFLWHGPIPYMPTSALYQEQMIPALRDRSLNAIDMTALRGLVCAPSFHTVSAVLYMTAAWPIARLRWPMIAINAAMLLATPIEGTHYLVDMIAGLLVALAAIVLVKAGLRLLHQYEVRTA
jgi:hypothetical protein